MGVLVQRFMKRVPSLRNSAGILCRMLAIYDPSCAAERAYSANSLTFSMATDVWLWYWRSCSGVVVYVGELAVDVVLKEVARSKCPARSRVRREQSGLAEKAENG
jgi:hypothetical protein